MSTLSDRVTVAIDGVAVETSRERVADFGRGSLLARSERRLSFRERFDRLSMPEPMSGCWLWLGTIAASGYGLHYVKAQSQRAHRVSWLLYRGPIPDGMSVCHRCDNRACVNPDHLFLGSCADNTQDMVRKGRHYHGERHHSNKLTTEQVLSIRGDSRPNKFLARVYGVRDTTIQRIKRGLKWAHLSNVKA